MTVDELIQLPGVGRKTANVITSVIDKQPNGCGCTCLQGQCEDRVDKCETPLEAEKQLIKNIPPQYVHLAHHWLILHGRYVCTARNPKCNICGIRSVCKFINKIKKS
jgi:endonuclease-3